MVDDLIIACPAKAIIAVHGAVDESAENFLGLGSGVFATRLAVYEAQGFGFTLSAINGVKFVDVSRFDDHHRGSPHFRQNSLPMMVSCGNPSLHLTAISSSTNWTARSCHAAT